MRMRRLIVIALFALSGCETLGHLKDERQGWTVYGPEGRKAVYSADGRLIRVIESKETQ